MGRTLDTLYTYNKTALYSLITATAAQRLGLRRPSLISRDAHAILKEKKRLFTLPRQGQPLVLDSC